MIDIHSHILPGIDDGAQSMDDSLEMLVMAADSGVRTIVTTPHCNIPNSFENYASFELEGLFEDLKRESELERIPIELKRGMEIFATEDLPQLLQRRLAWTLNDTDYFLVEFGFEEDPDFCDYILDKCSTLGYKPIIAHPERYVFVQDEPEIAYEWCTRGYGLQMNKGSILGRFGEQVEDTANALLEHGLIACIGSDAHGVFQRTTHMAEIYEFLCEFYGEQYAKLLLSVNPSRILNGKRMLGIAPISFYDEFD